MREERDGKFNLSVNLISRIPNPVELLHNWLLTNFKYHEPWFYSRLFDESEEGNFKVTPGLKKVDVIRKPVPCDPKLYVLSG